MRPIYLKPTLKKKSMWGYRALARFLKLPIICQRVPIQNGLKRSKMG